jgi:hypothetical protein
LQDVRRGPVNVDVIPLTHTEICYLAIAYMETLKWQVEHAASRMADRPDLDEDSLVGLLINDGFTDLLASRLNAFVPHAFGRILIESKHNANFASTFLLEDCHGLRAQVQFSREPIMNHATNLARNWMSTDENRFVLVANRSSEVNAAMQICDWDGESASIEFCEAVIIGIDPCEYGTCLKSRPWWRFW